MADVDFQVNFSGGEPYGGYRRFDPGADVAGTVTLVSDENLNARGIRAKVGWRTEGRGDTDSRTVSQATLAEGGLMAGLPQSFDFSFRLPQEPWSYAGHYLNIIWEVEINVDLRLAVDKVHRERIIVAPKR
jgi:hypothetical protein